MDDPVEHKTPTHPASNDDASKRSIDVKNHGEVPNLAAPTVDAPPSPTPEPAAPPSQPAASGPSHHDAAPIQPPKPGHVISSNPSGAHVAADGAIGAGPVVKSSGGGGGKRWLKRLVALLAVVLVIAAGWFVYDHFINKKPAVQPTQSKDIPLLKIGMNDADYGNLYPDMSTNEYSLLLNAQVFEGLVRYENKSKLVPALANNWTNPDDKTWVFTLKKGIKFHDGNTLGADDVKYSIDTVLANSPDLAEIYGSTIASVEVVNDSTVKIITKEPDPALLNRLAWLFIIDADLPKGDNASMAGTGPYQLKAGTTPTSTNVQLVAFNQYHGAKPTVHALSFGSEADAPALVKAFQAGKFNIVGPVTPTDAKKTSGAKEYTTVEPNVNFLGMNTVQPGPLQKKQVREAIRYAVSSPAISEAAGKQSTPLSQLIPESIPGYNPAIKPYKQNVAKAKQLLAEAGYPNGGLSLTLTSASDPAVTKELTAELKAVGIDLKVDQHDDFDEFIDYFTSGKAELFLVDYASDTLDGLDVYQSTLIDHYYSNPQVNDLLTKAATETNPGKRLKLLQQASTIVDQEVAVVPLYEQNDVWLMDQNYTLKQDLPSAYLSAYFSKVQKQ